MASKHIKRVTRRIPFNAAGTPLFYPLVLTAGYLLLGIDVVLKGSVTFAAGGGASGVASGVENPGNLVSSIEIDATPIGKYLGGKIFKMTPRRMFAFDKMDQGRLNPTISAAIVGGIGTETVSVVYPIRFALPNLVKPVETALRLDQFSEVKLTINTGDVVSMLTGNNRVIDYSALYFDVIEYRELAGPTGDYMPLGTLYQDDRPIDIAAANPAFAIDSQLSKSESYLDVLLNTEADNAQVDTILTSTQKVQVFEDITEFDVRFPGDIRAEMARNITDAATTLTGQYYLPVAQGVPGKGGVLLAGKVDNINLRLDVAVPGAANRIWVATRRFRDRLQ